MHIKTKAKYLDHIRAQVGLVTRSEAMDFALGLVTCIIDEQARGRTLMVEEDGVLEELVYLIRRKTAPHLCRSRQTAAPAKAPSS